MRNVQDARGQEREVREGVNGRQGVARGGIPPGCAVLGVASVFATLFLVVLVVLVATMEGLVAVGVAVVIWIALLFAMLAVLDRLPKRRGSATDAALVDYCLCCGYELDGLRAEDDGCVVCPECGAAWRGVRVS